MGLLTHLPPGLPLSTNRHSLIPSAWSTLPACRPTLKSNPGGMRALLRWHNPPHSKGSNGCWSEGFANLVTQKITWEILWDGLGRPLRSSHEAHTFSLSSCPCIFPDRPNDARPGQSSETSVSCTVLLQHQQPNLYTR